MYRRYAIAFNKKQIEFVNCVNMIERMKRARSHPAGLLHLGVKCYSFSTRDLGKEKFRTVRDCD